jgi:glucan phosphoethanolaminetransferase (alkaline phosphatase superfamily)
MPTADPRKRLEADICIHIFTVSAAMVGVCLTVIGLLRVVVTLRKTDTVADDLVAVDAILFLLACLSSYWALRIRSERRMHRVERFADIVFILALLLMVAVCGLITYAIAVVP